MYIVNNNGLLKMKIDIENESIGTINLVTRLWAKLNERRRRQIIFLLFVMILSGLAESFSVGAVFPFIAAISNPEGLWLNQYINPIAVSFGLQSSNELLIPTIFIFGTSSVLTGIIRSFNLWLNLRLASAITADLSVEAYKRTLYQGYDVQISRNSSKLISSIVTETTQTSRVITYITLLFTSSIVLLGILTTLVLIDYKIAVITMLIFGLAYSLLSIFVKNKLAKNSKLITNANESQLKNLQEALGSIRDVILGSHQDFYVDVYKRSEILLRNRQAQNAYTAYFPRFMMESLGLVMISVIAYFLVLERDSINEVLPVLAVLGIGAQRLIPAFQQIYTNWASIRDRSASVIRVLDLLNQNISLSRKNIPPINFKTNDIITLKNVYFRYSDSTPFILKDINIQIKKGERIGIIGRTGSGKSTLIDLMMGFLKPSKGKLNIDQIDLFNLSNIDILKSWQSSISNVPQNIFLSDLSIEENIAFGINRKDINQIRLKKACNIAQIDSFIQSTTQGYQTIVGERGVKLSGGQCQRLGIARALYQSKNILFLDEATSSIDTNTENNLINALEKISSSITIIMIAHRLSTLKSCTKVIELEDGCIKNIYNRDQFIQLLD